MKSYHVKESFYTLQGEGFHAGKSALFIRFAGCNLWSGRDEHRERDATRSGAECPRWCDTDFVDGAPLSAEHTVGRAAYQCSAEPALVVLTGGEPMLQVDEHFLNVLRTEFPNSAIAVETNGTKYVPRDLVDWICVSPKVSCDRLVQREGDELKVVFPAYSPLAFADVQNNFTHLFVTAEAHTSSVGVSLVVQDNLKRAADFCMNNPRWRLTLQAHKLIGIP